jgi:hypothetical protein
MLDDWLAGCDFGGFGDDLLKDYENTTDKLLVDCVSDAPGRLQGPAFMGTQSPRNCEGFISRIAEAPGRRTGCAPSCSHAQRRRRRRQHKRARSSVRKVVVGQLCQTQR